MKRNGIPDKNYSEDIGSRNSKLPHIIRTDNKKFDTKKSRRPKELSTLELAEKFLRAKFGPESRSTINKKEFLKRKSLSVKPSTQIPKFTYYADRFNKRESAKNSKRESSRDCKDLLNELEVSHGNLVKIYESTLEFEKIEAECKKEDSPDQVSKAYDVSLEVLTTQINKQKELDNKRKEELDKYNKIKCQLKLKQLEQEMHFESQIEKLTKENGELKKEMAMRDKDYEELSMKLEITIKENKELRQKLLHIESINKELPDDDIDMTENNHYNAIQYTKDTHKKLDLEKSTSRHTYSMIFPDKYHLTHSKLISTKTSKNGKILRTYDTGKLEVKLPNGVIEESFPDGYSIIYFVNKDIKQKYPDGTTVYYFAGDNVTQSSFPNGLKVFKYNDKVEKYYPDGSKEIKFSDGTIQYIPSIKHEELREVQENVSNSNKNIKEETN